LQFNRQERNSSGKYGATGEQENSGVTMQLALHSIVDRNWTIAPGGIWARSTMRRRTANHAGDTMPSPINIRTVASARANDRNPIAERQ
jgi:hypothetical protein